LRGQPRISANSHETNVQCPCSLFRPRNDPGNQHSKMFPPARPRVKRWLNGTAILARQFFTKPLLTLKAPFSPENNKKRRSLKINVGTFTSPAPQDTAERAVDDSVTDRTACFTAEGFSDVDGNLAGEIIGH